MLLSCSPVILPTFLSASSLNLYAAATPVNASSLKRGSEELLGRSSGSAIGNNGNSLVTVATVDVGTSTDAKKAKLEKRDNGIASKVVHIRNIPAEVTEAEIIHLGIPFGRVTNVLVLKGKNQAFLEMADEAAASTMVDYFTTCSAQLRGRAVYVQFSNHKELKTDQSHSNSTATAQAALQAAQALSGQAEIQGGPNTVLRIIIEHMIYPVTLDVLHQIFSRFGTVMKIVTFTKNSTFQVLIQYPDVVSAQSAKLSLDGQNIYNSCCTLRIEFSKLSSLNVKYNNDKSRDYTNPTLPNGDLTGLESALPVGTEPLINQIIMPSGQPTALQQAIAAGGTARRTFTNTADRLSSLPIGGFQITAGTSGIRMQSSVILVSNLCDQMTSPDALFTLFGVYGDVIRVKILYNKKDCALIQLAEPQQVQLAIVHLDKLRLFGKEIRVMQSKYQTVQMPKEGQPDAGLTKDYTSSPLHRFKKPGSKNCQNIYSPSTTLHLSNIPLSVTEVEIKEAFEKEGFNIKDFRYFPKDHKMALIQFDTLDEAVSALVKMHNYRLAEQSHLRVSFSKGNIQSLENQNR